MMSCRVHPVGRDEPEEFWQFAEIDTFVKFCQTRRACVVHPPFISGGPWEIVLMPEER